MAKLFPLLPFINDETPLSWASRQAAFHTGGRLVPFLNDLEIPLMDLSRGTHDAVARLCDITGQDPAPVFHNTITAVGKRRFTLRNLEFSAEFTTGAVTRICPHCLAEDMAGQARPMAALRHRLHWRFAPVRRCETHGVPLRDVRRGIWDDIAHELQAMMPEIQAELMSPSDSAPRSASALQSYVVDRIAGKQGPEWLDCQDIDQAARATEMLGGVIAFGAKQPAAKMTEALWDVAGETAFPIVSKGSEAVSEALLALIEAGGEEEHLARPGPTYGMLYSWLGASRLSKDPGPIRTLLREQIINNMAVTKGQMLLGSAVTEPKISSVAYIASYEHIHPVTLRNILRAAGLLSVGKGASKAERTLVNYADAKEIIELTKHSVPVSQLPYVLHASRPMVQSLIDLGLLKRLQDHDILKSKIGKSVDGRGIQDLFQFMKAQFAEVADAPAGFVDLAKAAEQCHAKLYVILELLFGGHLPSGIRLVSKQGFASLLVSPAEIKALLAAPPDGVSDEVRFHMM